MTSALAPIMDDLRTLLKRVADSDLGTLTLRREELKKMLTEKRYELNNTWVQPPQTRTEAEIRQQIDNATRNLRSYEAELPVLESLITKLETFRDELTSPEQTTFDSANVAFNIRMRLTNAKNHIDNYRRALARLGEPEPAWVDPRIKLGEEVATLEMALKEVQKAIKEKQNA